MITLSKIAKLAHVSVSTASKAFSMSKEVSPETREIIFDIARKHGCFKKYYKAQYPKLVVAVICPEFQSMIYAQHLSIIEKHLSQYNCDVCAAATYFSHEREKELLEYYSGYATVDAIIVIGDSENRVISNDMPILYTGDEVRFNLETGLIQMVDYFKMNGVKDIGYVGEILSEGRYLALCEMLEKKGIGIKEQSVVITEKRFEIGGYEATQKLFDTNSVPRVLVCSYDYMAIGAIRCILDNGLRVPEDVAVVGFDDIPEAEYLDPPLASINIATDKICETVTHKLMNILHGEKIEETKELESKFCLRRSAEII